MGCVVDQKGNLFHADLCGEYTTSGYISTGKLKKTLCDGHLIQLEIKVDAFTCISVLYLAIL